MQCGIDVMLHNKYLLGTIVAVFVFSVGMVIFQTAGKSDGFAAYAQTAKTSDAEKLLKTPQFRQQIIDSMKKDHRLAQDLIMSMINDPILRLQLIGHLTENKEAVQDLSKLFVQNPMKKSKDKGMMDHGSMSMKKDPMKNSLMKKDIKKDSVKSNSTKKIQ